jgi:5'-deoxynucleotidase YfbR-like HD superfamily hydrolase
MSNNRVVDLLNLSHVPRWSVVPLLRPQSVAEHSFRVAVIAMELMDAAGIPLTVRLGEVLGWALIHDGPEAETGDIPYNIKKYMPNSILYQAESEMCPWYGKTTGESAAIVKIADKIEEVTWLREWGNWNNPRTAAAFNSAVEQIRMHVAKAVETYLWSRLPKVIDELFNIPILPGIPGVPS